LEYAVRSMDVHFLGLRYSVWMHLGLGILAFTGFHG
jgi:hypothetical protein